MKRILILAVAAAALLAPSAAFAGGVVLKVQGSNHLIAVTSSRTHVQLVHTPAAARLHVGQRVALTAHRLRNGTFAASTVRVLGRTHHVHFRGLLLAKSSTRLVVSAGGAVVSVSRGARTTSSARDSGPPVGSQVDVTATVGAGDELDEDNATVVSPSAPGGSIEGTLTLGTGTVTVASEHVTLVLKVPAGLALTAFTSGEDVLATFTQLTDGSLQLTALSGDSSSQAANSDGGDQSGGGDQQGGDGGDD